MDEDIIRIFYTKPGVCLTDILLFQCPSDGFGIGYIIKDHGIQYSVSSKHRQTKRYVNTLENTLLELKNLLNSTSNVVCEETHHNPVIHAAHLSHKRASIKDMTVPCMSKDSEDLAAEEREAGDKVDVDYGDQWGLSHHDKHHLPAPDAAAASTGGEGEARPTMTLDRQDSGGGNWFANVLVRHDSLGLDEIKKIGIRLSFNEDVDSQGENSSDQSSVPGFYYY